MTPPDAPRECTACNAPLPAAATICSNCGASVPRSAAAKTSELAIAGFIALGLIAAIGTLVAWAYFGAFVLVSLTSGHHGPWQCAGSVAYDALSIGLCVGALIYGVRLANRGQTGFAIVLMLSALLGIAPATICTGSFLFSACGLV